MQAQHSDIRQSTVEEIFSFRDGLLGILAFVAGLVWLIYSAPWGPFAYIAMPFLGLCTLVFGMALIVPGRRYRGIVLVDGGFRHWAGVRGESQVHLRDIRKIVAVQTGGGGEGDEVLLEVHCGDRKVQLREHDYFRTGLHRAFFELPGFRHEQYGEAAAYQLKGIEHFTFKRFVVFEQS